MTERNPEIEAQAVKVLGYTPDQAKRKTMAQLQRELKKASTLSPKKKAVTFEDEKRRASTSGDFLDDIQQIHKCLRAKIRFTTQLEQDADFSGDDLAEWHKSIARTRRRLEKIIHRHAGDQVGGGSGDLNEWLHRREAKVDEMKSMGLLDRELLEKWEAKHQVIREICRVTNEEYELK